MAIDYRTAAQRCALCNVEMEAHALQDLIGLDCCQGCINGDLKQAMQHWGFVLEEKFTPASRHSSKRFFVEIKRPTFIEAFAKFDSDSGPPKGWLSRLFKKQDPQVGDAAFDDRVLIAPDPGSDVATMDLLEHEGVRAGVLALVEQGAIVDLTGNSIWIHDDDVSFLDKFADMDAVMPYAVALAVHIERIARGGGPSGA